MSECSCWVKYPNPMCKKDNGKWKCVDDYECIRDLEIKMTKVGVSCVSGKTHCRRKEGKNMDKVDVKNFDNAIEKQLAYNNRTFLRGHYNFVTKAEYFTVVKNGHVWEFETLTEAVDKYNEVVDDEQI